MVWLRTHFWGLLIIVAIVVSFVITRHDSNTADHARGQQAIAGCESRAATTAIDAAGWHRLAQRVAARNNAGDAVSAANYEGISRSMTDQLFAPPGMKPADRPNLVEVFTIIQSDKTVKFVLTPRADALQAAGCKARYT